jgi:hypothetical protein
MIGRFLLVKSFCLFYNALNISCTSGSPSVSRASSGDCKVMATAVPDVLSFSKEGLLDSLMALSSAQLSLCGSGPNAVR